LYFEEPDAKEAAQPLPADALERDVEELIVSAEPLPETRETERDAERAFISGLDSLDGLDGLTMAPLTDLVTLPMDSSNRVSCPFHDDPNPSCASTRTISSVTVVASTATRWRGSRRPRA
jgi:hypothetical protein